MRKNNIGKSKFFYQIHLNEQNDEACNICVGLSTDRFDDVDDADNVNQSNSYCLDCSSGAFISNNKVLEYATKGVVKPGSTISVLLDMDKGELSFIINGIGETALVSPKLKSGFFYPTIHMATHFDRIKILNPPVAIKSPKYRKASARRSEPRRNSAFSSVLIPHPVGQQPMINSLQRAQEEASYEDDQ